jgi:uncharacterized membrane protein YeaQ/YmgE (transglycosylase-associated protein family)
VRVHLPQDRCHSLSKSSNLCRFRGKCIQIDRAKRNLCISLRGFSSGGLVGWGTGKILQGDGYGPSMDMAVGIGGAVAGGFLMHSAPIDGFAGAVLTSLLAVVGAVVVTILAGLANGRQIYAS